MCFTKFIHNTTVKKNKTKILYKLLHKRKFDFTNIHVFGYNIYTYILKKVWISKQIFCTRTIIYLGLMDSIRRYKLYDPKRKVFFATYLMLFNSLVW
jgi:hypothetical protein